MYIQFRPFRFHVYTPNAERLHYLDFLVALCACNYAEHRNIRMILLLGLPFYNALKGIFTPNAGIAVRFCKCSACLSTFPSYNRSKPALFKKTLILSSRILFIFSASSFDCALWRDFVLAIVPSCLILLWAFTYFRRPLCMNVICFLADAFSIHAMRFSKCVTACRLFLDTCISVCWWWGTIIVRAYWFPLNVPHCNGRHMSAYIGISLQSLINFPLLVGLV